MTGATCFFPGRAKDLSARRYVAREKSENWMEYNVFKKLVLVICAVTGDIYHKALLWNNVM